MSPAEVDPSRRSPDLVAASQDAAVPRPRRGDAAPLLPGNTVPADWDAPVPGTGAEVFAGRRRARWRADSAAPISCTASRTTCWRRRFWRRRPGCGGATPSPTGSVEINAKRDGASAWAGVGTPDFVDVPTDSLLDELSMRLGWAERTRRAAGGTLRDDHAAVDGRRHDDLPGLVDGRPRSAGGPHRAVGARRRHPGGGEAHRSAADAVLRSRGAGAGMHAVRGGDQFVGDAVGVRQRDGYRRGSTGSATG